MSTDKRTDWRSKMEQSFMSTEPYLGHPLKPIPLRENAARTERVSTYVELDLLKALEEYAARGGFRSTSEVLRRLAIIGLQSEGYGVDGEAK